MILIPWFADQIAGFRNHPHYGYQYDNETEIPREYYGNTITYHLSLSNLIFPLQLSPHNIYIYINHFVLTVRQYQGRNSLIMFLLHSTKLSPCWWVNPLYMVNCPQLRGRVISFQGMMILPLKLPLAMLNIQMDNCPFSWLIHRSQRWWIFPVREL